MYLTVTAHSPIFEPSSIEQVMTALPCPMAVSSPFSSTFTTDSSDEDQVTFQLEASSGATGAESVYFSL